jgi:hypothetical protein
MSADLGVAVVFPMPLVVVCKDFGHGGLLQDLKVDNFKLDKILTTTST